MSIGYLLSDDLIFTSRITGTARELGLTLQPARTSAALLELVRRQTPVCAIVDLGNPTLQIEELIQELAACSPRPRVVAYGSHVDTETLRLARAAGCDVVWPRSKFVEELPKAMPGWYSAMPQG